MNPWMAYGLAFGAGMCAGGLNSIAGGGSFLSFPALILAGLPPSIANATNNLAMWVGTMGSMRAFRVEFQETWRGFMPAWIVAVVGGIIGAVLLVVTPESVFTRIIPWLILTATLIFAYSAKLRSLKSLSSEAAGIAPILMPLVFITGIYGGYFGAGIGIINLALLSLSGVVNIHRANAVKAFLGFGITGIACIPFIWANKIDWVAAFVTASGATVGSYVIGRISRRFSTLLIRRVVILIGIVMTVVFFRLAWKT